MRWVVVVVLAWGAAWPGAVRSAAACTLSRSLSVNVMPRDGSSRVPTNVQVVVEYTWEAATVDDDTLRRVVLQPAGGARPVDIDVVVHREPGRALVIVSPQRELERGGQYEVVVGTQVWRFTTGVHDGQPPVHPGETVVSWAWPSSCDSDACCGPFSGVHVELGWAPAAPADAVAFNLYEAGSATPVVRMGRAGYVSCSGHPLWLLRDPLQNHRDYVLRGVDLAGNEDGNDHRVRLDVDCGAMLADAGADAARPAAGDGGCAVGGGGGGAGGLLLAAALLVAWCRRR